jgi:hypothetical protein
MVKKLPIKSCLNGLGINITFSRMFICILDDILHKQSEGIWEYL